MGDRWGRCGRVLCGVPFVVSLAVLVLNDRWWKSAWPGAVTGKLSDLAGVVVAAVVLSVVAVALGAGQRRAAIGSAVVVGALFAAMKTSDAGADAAATVWGWINGGRNAVIADRTDLIALLALPVVPWAWRRTRGVATPATLARPLRITAAMCLLVVGIGATTATSCIEDAGVVAVVALDDRLVAIDESWGTIAWSDDAGRTWTDADWYEENDEMALPTTSEPVVVDGGGLSFPGSTVAPEPGDGNGMSFPGSTVPSDGSGFSFPGSTVAPPPDDGAGLSFPGSTVAPPPEDAPEDGAGLSFPGSTVTPVTFDDDLLTPEEAEARHPGYVVPVADRVPPEAPERPLEACAGDNCLRVVDGELVDVRTDDVVLEALAHRISPVCSSGKGTVESIGVHRVDGRRVTVAAMGGQGVAIREGDEWRRVAVRGTSVPRGFLQSMPPPWVFPLVIAVGLTLAGVAGLVSGRGRTPDPGARQASLVCALLAVVSGGIAGLASVLTSTVFGDVALIGGVPALAFSGLFAFFAGYHRGAIPRYRW